MSISVASFDGEVKGSLAKVEFLRIGEFLGKNRFVFTCLFPCISS